MNIQYYHKNIDALGEASRNYIEDKIAAIGELTKITQARVEVDQDKKGSFHMSVQVNNGRHVYYADAGADTVNGCIDQIDEELKKQIRRNQGRVRDLMRRGARSIKKKLTIDENARL